MIQLRNTYIPRMYSTTPRTYKAHDLTTNVPVRIPHRAKIRTKGTHV